MKVTDKKFVVGKKKMDFNEYIDYVNDIFFGDPEKIRTEEALEYINDMMEYGHKILDMTSEAGVFAGALGINPDDFPQEGEIVLTPMGAFEYENGLEIKINKSLLEAVEEEMGDIPKQIEKIKDNYLFLLGSLSDTVVGSNSVKHTMNRLETSIVLGATISLYMKMFPYIR